MTGQTEALPRLLYVGDVPVEASYHGSALLYRLLQSYPPNKLKIIESGFHRSLASRRLPAVRYDKSPPLLNRWLNTRFNRWISSALLLSAPLRVKRLSSLMSGFEPQAVLTVAHGYSWITAAAFARQEGFPLHLIIHDDLPRMSAVIESLKERVDTTFGRIYREARSRFCVSPFMQDFYHERYGAKGEVLYPSRAANCPEFAQLPEQVSKNQSELTVAFAGTINSEGYGRLLGILADSLRARKGTLLLFGPHSRDSLGAWANKENIQCRGLLTSSDLMQSLRAEVDVLFVPMSFDGVGQQENMRISFPSKLTDYTAVGLPLLICGPEYCSAVRWALENKPVAEVVTSENPVEMVAALERLSACDHRIVLASRAVEIGNRFFKQEVAECMLFTALQKHCQN